MPYWYGTFGQISNEELYNRKKKQYPSYYTATDFESQFGRKVHDCVGLIKGYLLSDDSGNLTSFSKETFRKYDKNVSGMLQNCSINGFLNLMPEKVGLILFNKNYTHVGIYIGNGEVIEARGHKYGVVKTNIKDRNWYKWGALDWLEYVDETEDKEMRYQNIEEIPKYAKETIQKLIDKKILKGNENGLDLSEDMIRILVINDRAGIYEN